MSGQCQSIVYTPTLYQNIIHCYHILIITIIIISSISIIIVIILPTFAVIVKILALLNGIICDQGDKNKNIYIYIIIYIF